MAKKYPYGFFHSSASNLTDILGNYQGSIFKVPSFLDLVILTNFSGSGFGTLRLVRNGNDYYNLNVGVEIQVPAEPDDEFYFEVVSNNPLNELFSYELSFRYSGIPCQLEFSSSST